MLKGEEVYMWGVNQMYQCITWVLRMEKTKSLGLHSSKAQQSQSQCGLTFLWRFCAIMERWQIRVTRKGQKPWGEEQRSEKELSLQVLGASKG